MARGQKLMGKIDQTLEADMAWESLHGPHIVPKKYVPPVLSGASDDRQPGGGYDSIYDIEIDGVDPKVSSKDELKA